MVKVETYYDILCHYRITNNRISGRSPDSDGEEQTYCNKQNKLSEIAQDILDTPRNVHTLRVMQHCKLSCISTANSSSINPARLFHTFTCYYPFTLCRYVLFLIWLLFKILITIHDAMFEFRRLQGYMLPRPPDSMSSWYYVVTLKSLHKE